MGLSISLRSKRSVSFLNIHTHSLLLQQQHFPQLCLAIINDMTYVNTLHMTACRIHMVSICVSLFFMLVGSPSSCFCWYVCYYMHFVYVKVSCLLLIFFLCSFHANVSPRPEKGKCKTDGKHNISDDAWLLASSKICKKYFCLSVCRYLQLCA